MLSLERMASRTITDQNGHESSDDESVDLARDLDLSWGDALHASASMEGMNTLRKAGHFCDVHLEIGRSRSSVAGHRLVLASLSPILFDMFTNEDELQSTHYRLPDEMDHDAVEMLVDYAYSGRLQVPAEMVRSVYRTAILLKVTRVAYACAAYLAEHLDPSTCLGVREFATTQSDAELTSKTDQYIEDNLEEVLAGAECRQLPYLQVDIIGLDNKDKELAEGLNDRSLIGLVLDWALEAMRAEPVQILCEQNHILILSEDNHLQNVADLPESTPICQIAAIQDYRKKRLKQKRTPGQNTPQQQQPARMKRVGSYDKIRELTTEYKLIATKRADQCCVAVALMGDKIIRMSVKRKPTPKTDEDQSSPSHSPRSSTSGDKCLLTPLTKMSTPRCSLGLAYIHDVIVAIGGYNRGEVYKSVESYDLTENRWTPMGEQRLSRGRMGVCELNGHLYAVGGSDGARELYSIDRFDVAKKEWTEVFKMRETRQGPGCAALNGRLYVVGGWEGQTGLKSCGYLDTEKLTWTSTAPLSRARCQAGVCPMGSEIVAVGGADNWTAMSCGEIYNPEEDAWRPLPQLNTPRRGAGAVCFAGRLYVVGGTDGTVTLASVEIYDPATRLWSTGPPLNTPRANVSVVVARNKLWVVGGFSGKHFLDTMEYLNEGGVEWCTFLPMDNTSK